MNKLVRVKSASGAPIDGNKLVRLTYMDESGISSREPILVQAAIIVNIDAQIELIEEYLELVIEKHIPEHQRENFVFHATDIYSGKAKRTIFKDDPYWTREKRLYLLDDLIQVVPQFSLPVFVGIVDKENFAAERDLASHTQIEISVAMHTLAIIQCEIGVELWMRENASSEFTIIIAEDNGDVKVAAKESHILLKSESAMKKEGIFDHPVFPFRKIKDGLQFATKEESRLLQIADACAWATRRAAENAHDGERFYRPLTGLINRLTKTDIDNLEQRAQ